MGRRSLDPEAAAKAVVERLQKAGHRALFAGGCVRDLLLGRTPNDYDVATSATPEQVRRLFHRTLQVGEQFGIVIVLFGGQQVEVATFRADGEYVDGRRPQEVNYTDDPAVDAQRRDFTVNGLFLDPLRGEVYDYVGGREDLAARRIRAIGDPAARFEEDKLRILRAPRFAATLGFDIEARTASEARRRAPEIEHSGVSPERIHVELDKLLRAPGRAHGARLASELGVLPVVLPEAAAGGDLPLRSLEALPPDAPLPVAWAALLAGASPEEADAALRRLRASNKQREAVVALLRSLPAARAAKELSLAERKRLLRRHGPELELLLEAWERGSGKAPEAAAGGALPLRSLEALPRDAPLPVARAALR
ncbi:MAG: CCA tRNA nucleotidyltransferase, partial [Planctomycetota bacterium]